jgi:hypothetical protein
MRVGRKRYIERRHALGLKAPGGRPRGPAKARTIARAQRIVERLKMAHAVTTKGDKLSHADKFSKATELALDIVHRILALQVDPDNVRLLTLVKNTALTIIGLQFGSTRDGSSKPPSILVRRSARPL